MALPPSDDTIAAIATAPGTGAIGIVRVAGPRALTIADRAFVPRRGNPPSTRPSHRVIVGSVVDERGDVLDEGVLLTFRAPSSYTGQDAAEFHVHGGTAILRAVLDTCLRWGARLAGPGEFTLRAVLAGKLDVVQAESVLAMVEAQTDVARRNAAWGLTHALSAAFERLQDRLIALLGDVTASLDYPEEGVEERDVRPAIEAAIAEIRGWLTTARAGTLARRGARVSLVGRPNVGKSSLLNALVGFERSIVSDQPGTTRDYVEAPLDVHGIPIVAIDTAGMRDTDDEVEAIGVGVARSLAADADVTLCVVEAHRPRTDEENAWIARRPSDRTVIVANKADLVPAGSTGPADAVLVSCVDGTGLDALKAAVHRVLAGDAAGSERWIAHERHADALHEALEALERSLGAPEDLMALDLGLAVRHLDALTGRGDIPEAVLEHVFANFCVGK